MREDLYRTVDDVFNNEEIENIFVNDAWYCRFIEDENNQKIGLVELSSRNIVDGCLSSPVAYLEGLYLEPKYRGLGIGKEVMQIIIQWCVQQGFSELATDTEIANERAQKFYESLGFEETDRVVEYRKNLSVKQQQ